MKQHISLCSVVLCTYNGEKFLAELLDSILFQSVPASEIIILDDNSSDGTVNLLTEYSKKYSQIKLHLKKFNSGPISSFETAIQLTNYPCIFLADQDDKWKPNKIESMLYLGACCPDDTPLLVYSDLEVIDENGKLLYPSFWDMAALNPQISSFNTLLFGNPVTGCASMFNAKMKEYLVSIPKGVLMHDHWIGLIAYGFGEVIVVNKQLVKYRVHGNSVTEKNHADLFWKIRIQFNQIFNISRDFLEREIEQAILFNQKFGSLLSLENQKIVNSFIDLKNRSLIKRKLGSYLRYTKSAK